MMEFSTVDTSKFSRPPVILITPDIERLSENAYTVRANYAEAISEAGGLPLILPYEASALDAVFAIADGVLITGTAPGVEADSGRRAYEIMLIERAIQLKKPLLGICYGMQLIGECLGGKCIKSLPQNANENVQHLPQPIPNILAHTIQLDPNSRLGAMLGKPETQVNSLHRHALAEGGRFRVVARASDGVIEAFEGDTPGFCLGLQWHPEYRLSMFDRGIFEMFVQESAGVGRHCASFKKTPIMIPERKETGLS